MEYKSFDDIFLDSSLVGEREHELENDVRKLVKRFLQEEETGEINVSRVKAGTSNLLFLIRFDNSSRKEKLLVRINGEETSNLISRQQELNILKQLGGLLCSFKNGIMYVFKLGKTLDYKDCRQENHQKGIARLLASYHSKEIEGEEKTRVMLFYLLDRWISRYSKKFENIPSHSEKEEERRMYLSPEKMKLEVDEMKKIFRDNFLETIVFCHNDLSSVNVIWNESKDQYHFIDFEYAGYNFRGFDIGDHFGEYAGLQLEDYIPPDEKMNYFIKEYLSEWKKRKNDKQEEDEGELEEGEEEEERIKKLFKESYAGYVVSNLLWGLWGFLMAQSDEQSSLDEFDYFEFAVKRMKIYFNVKKRLVNEII